MDALPQHACMAHIDEPVFCSSTFSALITPYLDLRHQLQEAPELTGHEYADDQDDTGGVALPPLEPDFAYTDALARQHDCQGLVLSEGDDSEHQLPTCTLHLAERADPLNLVTKSLPIERQSVAIRWPRPRGRSSLRRSRTESWENRQEEDSRRTRFALEGESDSSVPLFASHTNPSDTAAAYEDTGDRLSGLPTEEHSGHADAHQHHIRVRLAEQRLPSLELRSLPAEDWLESTREEVPGLFTLSHAHLSSTHLNEAIFDEDGLAVDDPRRNYDVSGFVERWRLRSFVDNSLPHLPSGAKVSLGDHSPPVDVYDKDLQRDVVDMQGLHWSKLGTSRIDALTAREMLHPSKHPFTQHSSCTQSAIRSTDAHYRFHRYRPQHRAKFSHYQLRNVLAASTRSDIFYATGNRVIQTSLAAPTTANIAMDLSTSTASAADFRITCLAASPAPAFSGYRSDTVLFAGGFYGEYAMLSLEQETSQKHLDGFVTHAYNGLVTHVDTFAQRHSGLLQAAFCSNDNMLRLMDVQTQRFTAAFTYGSALNCSATAPDGRLRVLVGDSRETFITDAEKGDTLVTLGSHTDHGFGCAWAPNGIHVATAAQDGKVMLWDARNWSMPLQKVDCVMSCARSVKFNECGLLVAAESEDVISIINPAQLAERQDIRFFGSIAGTAMLDGGSEIAVAVADKTVGGLLLFSQQSSRIKDWRSDNSNALDMRQQPWRSGTRQCTHASITEIVP